MNHPFNSPSFPFCLLPVLGVPFFQHSVPLLLKMSGSPGGLSHMVLNHIYTVAAKIEDTLHEGVDVIHESRRGAFFLPRSPSTQPLRGQGKNG